LGNYPQGVNDEQHIKNDGLHIKFDMLLIIFDDSEMVKIAYAVIIYSLL